MDQSAFYRVVAATNFTLLGLWWVAIKDREDLGGPSGAGRYMAYLVSLQFTIPAAVSLVAQVAPEIPAVWRIGFTAAGVLGAIGIALLARQFALRTDATVLPWVFGLLGVPLYLGVVVVAVWPGFADAFNLALTPIEVEALLLSLIVVLGVQEAWFVTMTPRRETTPSSPPEPDS
ncbi:hypothetical protein [Gordonia rhizosphera]|uniref:Uncharacterized protein n=1 Tax=Gordonia rhizosphera NBRC 16068 TaxID=1108045 RepID=K6V566_9ACTN|nr:hypothetical protein [Gordonia rhizosphera]GAB91318.1 hypothetical protein GORHZ_126_00590 [Gordonia rhizosphera NBRC 16068]